MTRTRSSQLTLGGRSVPLNPKLAVLLGLAVLVAAVQLAMPGLLVGGGRTLTPLHPLPYHHVSTQTAVPAPAPAAGPARDPFAPPPGFAPRKPG